MALPTSSAARKAPPRLRSSTTRSGSSGCGERSSMITKATSMTTAPTSSPMVAAIPIRAVPAIVNP